MLLDTSGLFNLHFRAEPFHALAVAEYKKAARRITHSFILAELQALGEARRQPREKVISLIVDLIDNPDIEVVWVEETLCSQAIALLMGRVDKGYSLCDAVSFVLMRYGKVQDALTTDHHFEQEGFNRLLV